MANPSCKNDIRDGEGVVDRSEQARPTKSTAETPSELPLTLKLPTRVADSSHYKEQD